MSRTGVNDIYGAGALKGARRLGKYNVHTWEQEPEWLYHIGPDIFI